MTRLSGDELLTFARAIAGEAGEIALGYFHSTLAVESKADRSPVTVADREAEKHLRKRIGERFPSHAILGEEFGAAGEDRRYRWLLDPVDGTQSFIRQVPLWGVMVGLECDGEALLGVVEFPALGEAVWARRGGGAWWSQGKDVKPARARVSSVAELGKATLLYTDPRGFALAGREQEFARLREQVGFERTWGDCYGHALVATGRAEIMLDPQLSEWDACALLPIVDEAGGHFTAWNGLRTTHGGSGISTNAALFEKVQKALRGT